jgi:hypothetical protein
MISGEDAKRLEAVPEDRNFEFDKALFQPWGE